MTHISHFSAMGFQNTGKSRKLKEFQVEVITFDGESETVYVEARDEAEASAKAADLVGNADYTLVYDI